MRQILPASSGHGAPPTPAPTATVVVVIIISFALLWPRIAIVIVVAAGRFFVPGRHLGRHRRCRRRRLGGRGGGCRARLVFVGRLGGEGALALRALDL